MRRRLWGKAGAATALGGAIAIALVLAVCSGAGHKWAEASAAPDSASASAAADGAAASDETANAAADGGDAAASGETANAAADGGDAAASGETANAAADGGDAAASGETANAVPDNATASATPGEDAAASANAEDAKGDVMQGAVLGADMEAFDAKFGASAQQDSDLTYSYEDGKLRVMENEGYAYNIYTTYSDRGETPSLDDALAFVQAFLPADAEPVREGKDDAVKTAAYVYKSKSLAAKTKLSGRLVVTIFRNPDDAGQIRQAMIAVDIAGNY